MFKRYKIHFSRPAVRPGRSERDAIVGQLKRFVSENGMVGDLQSIHPSAAFGIVEVRCTERLARRLSDMPEVETILEG
ncbi:hypothetical protein [Azospirillum sp. ST 5-10]|uniref:hypothetical protein n=1 Tax=unclassified Azospirillum TaxID=2630922 RepID=UPI003F4A1613